MKLQEYVREDGSNPYQAWFDELDTQAAAKVTVAKVRKKAKDAPVKGKKK